MYHLDGAPQLKEDELVDYAWVTKDEMKEFFSPELFQAVDDLVVDF
jgi:hypothetical protein